MAEIPKETMLQYQSKDPRNPYEILVSNAVDDGGDIRIEPPFDCSDEWLEDKGLEGHVGLVFSATDRHATILEYDIPPVPGTHWNNMERLDMTIGHIMQGLGELASKEAFIRAYEGAPLSDPIEI